MKLMCPMCNVPMTLADNVAGTTVACSTCGHTFVAGGGAPQAHAAPAPAARRPCPLCGASVAAAAVKCPNCRGTIGTVQCPACAESMPADAAVCPFCNTPCRAGAGPAPAVALAPGQSAPANKVLCLLIAFLFPMGIHRFIMGYTGIGVAQLVLSFCGIGIIWSWIDGIMIATGSLKMPAGRDLAE